MAEKTEKAVKYHKSFYSCSASVLCAFADEAGIDEKQAKAAAAPFAGGRMGKCGAVLAAEYVLAQKYGKDSDKISEFEAEFTSRNRSVMCSELRGGLRSCRGCVTDAAEILEKMLDNQ
ncbi:C-GCAxxG-C-C family protein [Ruminococcus flavefaciens]|uniref:Putative redox-active protein (C_GCAxxG_C_C) n=1 Tax=Ruminococcus flavefaciens TaxID=1265 RepID=A0A1M7IXK4_RUMFL|nr:C-GCAxxG-C-C family protein [Ruminococcus flavefaciens]SHM45544.1 Putative redox-active protein (C_GCAxxG_C_C) [Ruminococcus flavefaciens]